eukprot:m.2669 g.2669  ORF g.2669 m.2669 type:complete len:536 (+) comp8834_c0_seq1:86-1693(+)
MSSFRRNAYVVGVGMTKFEKPGSRENFDYPEMARESVNKALKDAGISYKQIQQAVVGYCYGDSTSGQRALYGVGLTGIPIYNVNNNCSTGSTALMMAKQLVEGGICDCILAVGFDKMAKTALTAAAYPDRASPMDRHIEAMVDTRGFGPAPFTPQLFGNAGREHMEKYGTKPEHFAMIAQKNHKHSVLNPYSQFRDEYTVEQIMKSKMIHEPLTLLQCCPRSDGSAAAIVCSEEFVKKHYLESQAIQILAMEMATDFPSSFTEKSSIKLVGYDMTKAAAGQAFAKTGLRPGDVHVVELHDCFATNELITYEALGLCREGEGGKLVESGNNTYGGKYVVNPSGGLISKGHPLGATGLAQCTELCMQLRGACGPRQVPGAKVALQHNLGLGGAVIVALYRHGFPQSAKLASKPMASSGGSGFKCAAAFDQIEQLLKTDGARLVPRVKGIFEFQVTGGPNNAKGTWIVDAKNGSGSVRFGEGKGDVTLIGSDSVWVDIFTKKIDSQKAFLQGKLKVKGNMALALKLKVLQPPSPKSKL